jgi:hypothetical protein
MIIYIYIYGLYGEKHVENHQPDMVYRPTQDAHVDHPVGCF